MRGAVPPLDVALVSTYDLGRPPFGVAMAAAFLARAGHRVSCHDLAVEPLDEARCAACRLIGVYVPMHTATRAALRILPRLRRLAPQAHLAAFGLYAPPNEEHLRALGVDSVWGGEWEEELVGLAGRVAQEGRALRGHLGGIFSKRLDFPVPERSGLPPLGRYARLRKGEGPLAVVGATEASRGCKHRCRHCPVVPVYQGRFRVVPLPVVLADIRQQVEAGAEHITFGDPDFFNGIGHALRVVEALHREFPHLTYDATIKVEHLLRYAEHLETLVRTGCLFVTSALESFDDAVLARLEKGHTRADIERAARCCRRAGLVLEPTFIAFHPWTTLESYREMLLGVEALDLVEAVAPVQWTLRLLIPRGSRLLELPEVRSRLGPFDETSLVYPWSHEDPRVEALETRVRERVVRALRRGEPRERIYGMVRQLADEACGRPRPVRDAPREVAPACTVPYLTEPWYC